MGGFCKVLLIIAIIALILGSALFVGVLAVNGWGFGNIGSKNNVTNTHTVTEDFGSIAVVGSSDSVVIVPSEDGICRIECTENEKRLHSVKIENGTLKIAQNDNLSWLEKVICSWNKTSVKVYLPVGVYEKLTVDTTAGDVSLGGGFVFSDVDISLTTGNVSISDLTANDVKVDTTTGDITVSLKLHEPTP